MVKFDKHGLQQIGKILGLFMIKYYYIFTILLSLLISERTPKAPFAYKIQSSRKLRKIVNE